MPAAESKGTAGYQIFSLAESARAKGFFCPNMLDMYSFDVNARALSSCI